MAIWEANFGQIEKGEICRVYEPVIKGQGSLEDTLQNALN